MRHRLRESNRLSDPNEAMIGIVRIGPPITKLAAAEIRAGFRHFRVPRRPVVNESLATTDLIEVQARIMKTQNSVSLYLGSSRQARCIRTSGIYATDSRPFLSTNVSIFSDGPRGCFSPRSHWLTKFGVTLR